MIFKIHGITCQIKQEHVRNGLGDNLITSSEQADSLLGIMKLMNAIDKIGE